MTRYTFDRYAPLTEQPRPYVPASIQHLIRLLFSHTSSEQDLLMEADALDFARGVAADLGISASNNDGIVSIQARNCVNGESPRHDAGTVERRAGEPYVPGSGPVASIHYINQTVPGAETYAHIELGIVPVMGGKRLVQAYPGGFSYAQQYIESNAAQNAVRLLFPNQPDVLHMLTINVGYLEPEGTFIPGPHAFDQSAFGGGLLDALHKISSADVPDLDFKIGQGVITQRADTLAAY